VSARPHSDGSAGDVDYAALADGYRDYRRPDPRIRSVIVAALGDARSVLNVGAGAGSYEPIDRQVTAVEPSASMRAQRPAGRPAVDAMAESLPFADDSFDASMTTFSVHQWADLEAGLREMRRVTRGPVIVLSGDPATIEWFWLSDYAPEVTRTEASRYPAIDRIAHALGGEVDVAVVPVPFDCVDGFNQAYYGRPELLLDAGARRANSAWTFVGPEVEERFTRRLRADLSSGVWDSRYGDLRGRSEFDGALRLVVARPVHAARSRASRPPTN
jgi:SAM-dependent methyltransferase